MLCAGTLDSGQVQTCHIRFTQPGPTSLADTLDKWLHHPPHKIHFTSLHVIVPSQNVKIFVEQVKIFPSLGMRGNNTPVAVALGTLSTS